MIYLKITKKWISPIASGNWKSDLQQHIRGEIPSDKDILKKIGVEVEKILIEESLIATDGIKSEAAKLLGWGRNTLARKAKKTK